MIRAIFPACLKEDIQHRYFIHVRTEKCHCCLRHVWPSACSVRTRELAESFTILTLRSTMLKIRIKPLCFGDRIGFHSQVRLQKMYSAGPVRRRYSQLLSNSHRPVTICTNT
jgi:hypothetical protein